MTIKVGDLVVVVKPSPCGCYVGTVRTVLALDTSRECSVTCQCKSRWSQPPGTLAKVTDSLRDGWLHLSWLKRIPPLDELENTKEETPHEIQL